MKISKKMLLVWLIMVWMVNVVHATTLPVINPASVEINGHTYHVGDTITVTTPTANVMVSVSYSALSSIIEASDIGNPSVKLYAYLCTSPSQESCVIPVSTKQPYVVSHPGMFSNYNDLAQTATTSVRDLLLSPGKNTIQVVFSGAADQFLGMNGHVERTTATGGTLTINYVAPHNETLWVNSNALASAGTLTATANQTLLATVTANSDDQKSSGLVFVAAYLSTKFWGANRFVLHGLEQTLDEVGWRQVHSIQNRLTINRSNN